MDKSSNSVLFMQECSGKIAVFSEIMTISTDLAILNVMSSFVLKYWLHFQILVAILNDFFRKRWDH